MSHLNLVVFKKLILIWFEHKKQHQKSFVLKFRVQALSYGWWHVQGITQRAMEAVFIDFIRLPQYKCVFDLPGISNWSVTIFTPQNLPDD